ncbi:enoyl-CoA hydratase-related protein [Bosea psychrotolerans]|uniref:Short chain enoyl-CoA hydratase n=1 Tax=Bosea psychrotolerans TaxID=1871628 RepID=A0A2S4LS63_9HYPH|nr:enoyl-CoA hydratase-related protein [Bosea psychrotolerans]POR45303.1 short chain enoyl-CoA hydratase [Bosea psychrotolerans]
MHAPDPVALHHASDGVAVITLSRPERRNALNLAIKGRIADAVLALEADASVRVIVLTGAVDYFIAGTDIAEMEPMSPAQHQALETDRMFTVLRRCPKILIAAVEGYALGGGCETALCCDMIVAGEGARFGQPEIRVGIMPGAGGTQRLLWTIGKYRMMKLVLTGELLTAADAFQAGLLSEIVADGSALPRALAIARTVAAMPPLAVQAIKDVVQRGQDLPLDTALALERKAFVQLFDTQDQKEGMRAFLEKRPPRFTGQ